MPLAHFTNLTTATELMEVIYNNLYEVLIFLPEAIEPLHGTEGQLLLLENTTKISFPKYPVIESKQQKFKYSTREYLMFPDKTSTDLDIDFNMNQGKSKQVHTFRMMKDWYDLVWNNEDGSVHYKKDIIGDIIVHHHDKEGHIIRRVSYFNCQIKEFSGYEDLSWDSADIFKLNAKFVADYWTDFYY